MQRNESTNAFGDAVEKATMNRCGTKAGGTGDITTVEEALQRSGFQLHDAAAGFLKEYHGLMVDVPITGADDITGFVHFAPEMVLRFVGAADRPRLGALMPTSACPVGTTGGHTVFVFLDESGESYLLDMEWLLFAELARTPAEIVHTLCDGQNGRVDSYRLDQHGQNTGEVIREGDERRHWQLEYFPGVAAYLPPVSLSPARRPPTWRSMVRSVEPILSQGHSPAGLMVTCGGFVSSSSGETFFLGHCENSIYVRSKAGFQVSLPPPGIAQGFRVGEIMPFTVPSSWNE